MIYDVVLFVESYDEGPQQSMAVKQIEDRIQPPIKKASYIESPELRSSDVREFPIIIPFDVRSRIFNMVFVFFINVVSPKIVREQ